MKYFEPKDLVWLREMSLDPIMKSERDWRETGKLWAEHGLARSLYYNGKLVASVGMIMFKLGEAHVWGIYSFEIKYCIRPLIRKLRMMLKVYANINELDVIWTSAAFPAAERYVKALGFKRHKGMLWKLSC